MTFGDVDVSRKDDIRGNGGDVVGIQIDLGVK